MNPGSVDAAIKIGREKRYDLIMIGYVETFFGGICCNSRASISLRLIDIRNNVTLWYVVGSMEEQPVSSTDYILFKTESKEAPSGYLLSKIVLESILSRMCDK